MQVLNQYNTRWVFKGEMRIPIVDDNKQDLYLLQKVLDSRDYHVETVANGEDAIIKAK